MKHVIDELQKSQRYHLRQLEENLNKIRTYEEAGEDLKVRNESHKEAISEIRSLLEQLEKAEQDGNLIQPITKQSKDIISGVVEI
jgi:signal transduction histidine kinase